MCEKPCIVVALLQPSLPHSVCVIIHSDSPGQIDLQGSMSDVVKDIRAAVACQQKSIIWESEQ